MSAARPVSKSKRYKCDFEKHLGSRPNGAQRPEDGKLTLVYSHGPGLSA